MTPRRADAVRLGVAVTLLVGLLAPAARAAPGPAVDYVYVDANEGGASGGHSAIRFGDLVFHFEYRTPGMIRLRRDRFESLRYRYTVLDNRTIVLHRVAVSEDTYRLLLDEFTRRYIAQEQDLQTQAAVAADRRLLEALDAWRSREEPEDAVSLEGVGLFFERARIGDALPAREPLDPGAAVAPALATLRDRVVDAHGSSFVREAMEQALRELRALKPVDGFAARYRDAVTSLLALRVLREARPLRAGAGRDGPLLEPADVELIGDLAAALESSLIRLIRSNRPDRGFPLLVGMARLIALDESRRAGRWRLLDAFAPDAPVIAAEHVLRRSSVTQALLEEARDDFSAARARLRTRARERRGFPESDFADLEAAGNRVSEISQALERRGPMRLAAGLRVPSRAAVLAEPVVSAIDAGELAQGVARAREREKASEAELRRRYGYDLFTRNCVTEIFRTIEAALTGALPAAAGERGEPAELIRRESMKRLGGHVDTTLNFIPAASARAVRDAYAVSETIEIPSHRLAELARLYRRHHAVRVYLRESNTLTSTLYARNPDDSAFLFFTDDTISARPLLGAINLVTGLGVTATGLFTLPVDGGETLRAGLRGMLFSLPELAFFNIRKGSLMFAPRGR